MAKNRLLELAEKRIKQAKLAEKLGRNQLKLSEMSDSEIRCFNISQNSNQSALDIEIKQGVTFGDVYRFAYAHYGSTNFKENLLNEPIDKKHTLLWSGGDLADLIYNRKMNQAQYKCCEKVADRILSENHAPYISGRK